MNKPARPMLTSGQKPLPKDSGAAFILLVIGLFVFLPWERALLCIGAIFGVALPFVLIERQMIFAYNDGRPYWHWELLGYVLAVAGIIGLGIIQMHRLGLLAWWPA